MPIKIDEKYHLSICKGYRGEIHVIRRGAGIYEYKSNHENSLTEIALRITGAQGLGG